MNEEFAWLDVYFYDIARRAEKAIHWYADIYFRGYQYICDRELTRLQAEEFNKDEEVTFYKEGTRTPQFDTEDDARAAALAQWEQAFPEAQRLIEGKTKTARFTGLEAMGTLLATRSVGGGTGGFE